MRAVPVFAPAAEKSARIGHGLGTQSSPPGKRSWPVNPQRRVFLKVLATGTLAGCGGSSQDAPVENAGGAVAGGIPSGPAGGSSAQAGASGSVFNAAGGSSGAPSFGGRFGAAGGNVSSGGSSAGAVSSAGAAGSASGTGGSPNPGVLVGNARDFPVGALSIAAGLFLLGRDSAGIYVMSMQCTHKGCAVGISGDELLCPCHQARFDRWGNVLGGPAPTPLPHFAVYVDAAGNISVDQYTVVSSGQRTSV